MRWLVISSFLFIFLRLPSLFEPYWYGDEGIYLTLGQGVNHGLLLYRDLHDNKPPLLYYLAALSQTVFGFRLLLLLLMIPTIYFFYRLSKNKLSTTIFLILTSIPLLEGHIANAEIFMLLPTIIGVISFFSKKYLLSGLFFGLAFTLKVPILADFGFLCLWLFFVSPKNLKSVISLVFGFILPIGLWSVYFFLHQAFPQFIFSSLLQNFGYISSWSTGSHSGSVTQGGLVIRFIFFIFSLFVLYLLNRRKTFPNQTIFYLGWLAAALFGALLSSRPYPHYLIQVVLPFCLLLPCFFRDRRLLLIPALLAFIIFKYQFYFYPVTGYYQNFYSYILKLKPRDAYYKFFGSEIVSVHRLAQFINQNSSPSDRLFVWGDHPYLYPLSDRLPATKYVVAYHIVDFNGYQLTIDQLRLHLPKFVVYYSQPSRPFPELDLFVNRYYFIVNQVGSALIFQLR